MSERKAIRTQKTVTSPSPILPLSTRYYLRCSPLVFDANLSSECAKFAFWRPSFFVVRKSRPAPLPRLLLEHGGAVATSEERSVIFLFWSRPCPAPLEVMKSGLWRGSDVAVGARSTRAPKITHVFH